MTTFFQNLEVLFNPKSVAVVGASDKPNKLGFHVMKSLTQGGFAGKILPVNPTASEIMGIQACPSLSDFSGPVDQAIVVVPSKRVPGVFRECAQKGVKGIVLISAGFREIDDSAGAALHKEIEAIVRDAEIPVIGPNTFGMINFHADLNASFTPEFSLLKRGGVCLVSQSGGISHLLGFMAMRMDMGFSKIIGLGNRLNVDFPQVLEYLMRDDATEVIVLYVEGIDDPAALLGPARELIGRKPIIAYKTGKGTTGNQACLSHTGSMAGRHEIYTGALNQAGILTVHDTEALLDAARAMGSCPAPSSRGMAVLSGQAGPSMAACDFCEEHGLQIARFAEKTQEKINRLLPPLALRTNPVDMGPAWYDSSAIEGIVEAVLDDENVDGILFLMMFASANRDAVKGISGLLRKWKQKKPVISCILSPPGIWDKPIRDLEEAGALLNYPTPERAAQAMVNLWKAGELRKRGRKGLSGATAPGGEK